MGKKRINIPLSELKEVVAASKSFREVYKRLGFHGMRYSIKNDIINNHLDISHFKGQGWNKNNYNYSRFKNGQVVLTMSARDALIFKRGRECQCCHNKTWNGQPIPLEVHHVDGNKLNNSEDNLLLLCPNCHALTENYCGRNENLNTVNVKEEDFVKALCTNISIRQALMQLGLTPRGGNYERAHNLIVKYNIKTLL